MISVSNLAKSFGGRTLFEDVSFNLNPGERYGLVGANGSGKTTLLNILARDLDPDEGSVSVPKSARLGVLRQDQFLFEDEEILSVALRGNPELWEAMAEKEKLLEKADGGRGEFDAARFGELEEIVQRYDGYTAEARAARILEGLGIPGELHRQPLSTLSGGFKLRVLLARVLAGSPDALLLDEPTNHLDIVTIRWLEKFLRDFEGPVVVISHDHRFLDNVCTRVLDVDYRTVTLYHGGYTDFQEQKVEERERREKEIEKREREIARHREFVDRFRAKASKARQAQSKLRLIEKKAENLEELPTSSRRYPAFGFEQRRPSGKEVLRVEGVRKSFGGEEVLHGVDLTVSRGDRVAVLGPNGIGKSTLLKIVVGRLEPDAGEVEWGYETHPGYFAQDHHEQIEVEGGVAGNGGGTAGAGSRRAVGGSRGGVSGERTAEEWLRDFCPGKDRGFVRGHMGLMLFEGDDGAKPLRALSGGEAARLVFARLLLEKPNVLVLDEPTNHLDLESIEALVEGLKAFEGTLILVSHDRWFVKEIATRIVEITPDGITDYPGTYEEYVHACGDDHLDADTALARAREKKRRRGRKEGRADGAGRDGGEEERLRRRREDRRRELESRSDDLATRIQEAEDRIAEIEAAFARPGYFESSEPAEVAELERERSALQDDVAVLMDDWEAVERRLQEEAAAGADR